MKFAQLQQQHWNRKRIEVAIHVSGQSAHKTETKQLHHVPWDLTSMTQK